MTLDAKERRYLDFIGESILRVQGYVNGTREDFMADPMAQDAVVWRLQSIADAARNHLSDGLKDRHPEIRWRAVYGFRNVAAHGDAGPEPRSRLGDRRRAPGPAAPGHRAGARRGRLSPDQRAGRPAWGR